LQIQKNKRGKHFKNIKNLLDLKPPSIPPKNVEKSNKIPSEEAKK
jgi:hypothetical protein